MCNLLIPASKPQFLSVCGPATPQRQLIFPHIPDVHGRDKLRAKTLINLVLKGEKGPV
jgi:hypothetical protein